MEDKRDYMKITEDKGQMNGGWLSLAERLWSSIFICLLLSSSFSLLSCSEDDDSEGEYDNWQERNEGRTDQWAVKANNGTFEKILTYSKDESSTPGLKSSDYIYIEVLERGTGKESPIYTDIVRIAYRGHLIPSKSYSEGYVFDQSYVGDFDWKTAGMTDMTAGGTVEGFATALMNMHEGDRWRVYIPYQLGYGTTQMTGIPAYSNLVFDIALKSFWHMDEDGGKFKSR